jgi:hypothetical protein
MTGVFGRIAGLFGRGAALPRPDPVAEPVPGPGAPPSARAVVAEICKQMIDAQGRNYAAVKLGGLSAWETLKAAPYSEQVDVAMEALKVSPIGTRGHTTESWQVRETRRAIASQLMRKALPFTAEQLIGLVDRWAAEQYSLQYAAPGIVLLGAIERLLAGRAPTGALLRSLENLKKRAAGGGQYGAPTKFDIGVAMRVEAILDPSRAVGGALPTGPFAASLEGRVDVRDASWRALLLHAAGAGDKAKPAAKWLAEGNRLTAAVDRVVLADRLIELMDATTPDPATTDLSLDILKGLVWLSVRLDQDKLAGPVGRFAEKCFRKVAGIGARSVKLGNAALWALSEMDEAPTAAAELFRLRTKLKLPSVRKALDTRLAVLAEKSGTSLAALEDASLPDFGLGEDGSIVAPFDGVTATIAVRANEVELVWRNAEGKVLKAPPAAVLRDHKEALATLKQSLKDIAGARATQAIRLEQSWLEDRRWPVADWRRNFLGHPLRRQLAEALIWQFETPGATVAAIPEDGALQTLEGPATLPDSGTVKLWHPLDGTPGDVLAWRRHIVDRERMQPIKQAHREIYVLTDAERTTRIYSNRFAAHILRQHQFRALCQAREWQFEFLGGWDSWNLPSRALPGSGVAVEYHVEAIENDQRSAAYIPLHLATDQVRFIGADGQPMVLETIPPIVFSEVLRDVDLFVAVTSVANDPEWTDGGPDGRYGGYWREYAFGDLSQTAETRRDLIAAIAPKLAIADRLEIGDKFLIVTGKRQKYAIHFGSSNIQILPSNRYLCIVPDRGGGKAAERVKLPFAGDSLLSIILSKAFLLVDESQIKDPTILAQL